jgi:hypothetical protein
LFSRLLVALVGLAAVGGCAVPGAGTQPAGPDPIKEEERLQQQARDALARWDAALAAAGGTAPRAFVPVGDLTTVVGEFEPAVGDNNKAALTAGEVTYGTLPVAAPGTGEVRWHDGVTRTVDILTAEQALEELIAPGNHDCGGCVPLYVTGATLVTSEIQTGRGRATVPTWEYTLEGTAARISRVAVAPASSLSVEPPPWDSSNPPAGLWIESAEVSADGRRLTAHFTGSKGPATEQCGVDYTARVVESTNAVVVIIDGRRYDGPMRDAAGREIACDDMGFPRMASVDLAEPLGERAVLEVKQGQPVPVTFTA